ncbi:hypothetical protein KFK09_018880 [Dendrobium nobile]|uniref:Uncharacterized protein n=1 Tax=Dendrobium nobile TaxID=94219 RepID=A0A8T3AX59_DENNO|nr:hypothetical protein KFK09_018880 [Dendrobium nobile]
MTDVSKMIDALMNPSSLKPRPLLLLYYFDLLSLHVITLNCQWMQAYTSIEHSLSLLLMYLLFYIFSWLLVRVATTEGLELSMARF